MKKTQMVFKFNNGLTQSIIKSYYTKLDQLNINFPSRTFVRQSKIARFILV